MTCRHKICYERNGNVICLAKKPKCQTDDCNKEAIGVCSDEVNRLWTCKEHNTKIDFTPIVETAWQTTFEEVEAGGSYNDQEYLKAKMDRAKAIYDKVVEKRQQALKSAAYNHYVFCREAYAKYLEAYDIPWPESTYVCVQVHPVYALRQHVRSGYGYTSDEILLLKSIIKGNSEKTSGVYRQIGHISEGAIPLRLEIDLFGDDVYMLYIARRLQKLFQGTRDGYTIDIHGGCFKGPQGVNWKILIEFEDSVTSNAKCKLMTEYLESVGVKREAETHAAETQAEEIGS